MIVSNLVVLDLGLQFLDFSGFKNSENSLRWIALKNDGMFRSYGIFNYCNYFRDSNIILKTIKQHTGEQCFHSETVNQIVDHTEIVLGKESR